MADTVPAMLEPGEFVIRKDAAKVIGPGLLHMLNNADRVGFNGGGKQDGGYINEYQNGGFIDKLKRTFVDDEGLFRGERGEKGAFASGHSSYPIESIYSGDEPPTYEYSKAYKGSVPLDFKGEKSHFHGILGRLADRRLKKDLEGIATDFRREYAPEGEGPYSAGVRESHSGGDPILDLQYRKEYEPWGEKFSDELGQKIRGSVFGEQRKRRLEEAQRAISGFSSDDYGIPEESSYSQRAREAFQRKEEAPKNVFQLLKGLAGKQHGGYINEYEGGGYADSADSYSLLDLTMPMLNNRLGGTPVRGYQEGDFVADPRGIMEQQGFGYDPEYGESIQAYDPSREQQLRTGMMGTMSSPYQQSGQFAGIGGFGADTTARKQMERQYMGDVAGMRSDYRTGVESQMAQDIASGTYEFTEARQLQNPLQTLQQMTAGGMPPSPSPGQEWTNTNTNITYVWNGQNWVESTTPGFEGEGDLYG